MAELGETVQVLWQTALVRSGFTVPDPNVYFSQVEALLRKSLGVSRTATARDADDVKPAPEVDDTPLEAPSTKDGGSPSDFPDWSEMKDEIRAKAKVVESAEEEGTGAGGSAEGITEEVIVEALPVVEAIHDEL